MVVAVVVEVEEMEVGGDGGGDSRGGRRCWRRWEKEVVVVAELVEVGVEEMV